MKTDAVSVIVPARNEAATIGILVHSLRHVLPDAEIIIVNDGSSDNTEQIAAKAGAKILTHPVNRGNGAAIKTGARNAAGSILVMMDADGQHNPADIPRLLAKLDEGYDLVIGARNGRSQASLWRLVGNFVYNRLASAIVGHPVEDLTSGLRAVRADRFREFLHLYPNGFSYPTTSTMCFYRAGYGIAFVPIQAGQRQGPGHIRILLDGGRFLLIIFRVGTLYSPLKIFFPFSLALFCGGIVYCIYTLTFLGRFTNFGALLFVTSLLVFFMGLISEQITQMQFAQRASHASQLNESSHPDQDSRGAADIRHLRNVRTHDDE